MSGTVARRSAWNTRGKATTDDPPLPEEPRLRQILHEHGVFDGDPRRVEELLTLTDTYQARTYCVQYLESDCDFITRLMEEAGCDTTQPCGPEEWGKLQHV